MSFLKKLKIDIEGEEEPKKKEIKPVKQDWLKADGELTVDVYQTETDFCIRTPVAGVNPNEIDISVDNNMLIIKGERKESEEVKEKDYFYKECFWGSFSRQVALPEDVDANKIKASWKKGVLTIKIPKLKKKKKKKVNVSVE